MNRLTVLLWILTCSSAWASPAPLEKFGWFAVLAGSCWSGTFPDGQTRHEHCYSTQFDRFLRGSATLSGRHGGDFVEQFSGDSVYAWNDAEQRIDYTIWGSDGSLSSHAAYYEGDELVFPVESRKEPGRIAYRSVWRRLDPDSIEVRREVPEGDGWTTTLTVLYRRSPAP
jgi:hypothetical protein